MAISVSTSTSSAPWLSCTIALNVNEIVPSSICPLGAEVTVARLSLVQPCYVEDIDDGAAVGNVVEETVVIFVLVQMEHPVLLLQHLSGTVECRNPSRLPVLPVAWLCIIWETPTIAD